MVVRTDLFIWFLFNRFIMAIETRNDALRRVLELTQRKQSVSGKLQEQVVACVLRFENNNLSTTSLVRDGKTSLARFTAPASGDDGTLCIPDIDRLLGVLNAHGTDLKLELDGSKLRVKSGSKTTTLLADLNGLAFPHSSETIGEWEDKSLQLSESISSSGYKMRSGENREPFFSLTLEAVNLFEALRCDAINGQKLNRYHFTLTDKTFTVAVGDELKGATDIVLAEDVEGDDWEWTFEGGLEHILKPYSGDVELHFFDFRKEGQGIRVLMLLPDGSWVFQAGIIPRD